MAINTISRQKPTPRPQFNPALVKTVAWKCPELTLKPQDGLRISAEGSQPGPSETPAHLEALKGNFEELGQPNTPAAPEQTDTDLRASLRDWLPLYAPYLDVASLEALS